MDKWTFIGVVITAVGASITLWLVKSFLTVIIDNWAWVLLGMLAVLVVGLLAVKREGGVPRHDL